MVMDPTIGTGTALDQQLNELLNSLSGAQGSRAALLLQLQQQLGTEQMNHQQALMTMITFLQAAKQAGVQTYTDLLNYGAQQRAQQAQAAQRLYESQQQQQQAQAQTGISAAQTYEQALADYQAGRISSGQLANAIYQAAIGERAGRANLASGTFNTLLSAEQEAARSPVGLLDMLSLGQRYGSMFPLTQVGGEELSSYGFKPGTYTNDLYSKLQGFMEQDPYLQGLQGTASGFLQPGAYEQSLPGLIGSSIQGAQQAVAGPTQQMQDLYSRIIGTFTPGAGERAAQQAMWQSAQPDQQINNLLAQYTDTLQPSQQQQDVSNTLQAYGQGAIPQATVRNVYRNADGSLSAFVQLPDGSVTFTPISGTGMQTVQGTSGPYSINSDDANALYQRQLDTYNTSVANLGATDRAQADTYITNLANERRAAQQHMADLFRTANPNQRQDLINFIGNTPAGMAGGGRVTSHEPILMLGLRTGRRYAVAGEEPNGAGGYRPERIKVTPMKRMAAGGVLDINSPRDVRFRYEDYASRYPSLDYETLLSKAKQPGLYETSTDPLTIGSRLLGGAVASDVRFADPFVRALALGRRPTGAEVNMRDYSLLRPEYQGALQSIIGANSFPSWLWDIAMGSPTGISGARGLATAGVRA